MYVVGLTKPIVTKEYGTFIINSRTQHLKMRALFSFETLDSANSTTEHKSQVTRIINLVSC